jgi:hypothetical protein
VVVVKSRGVTELLEEPLEVAAKLNTSWQKS